MNNHDAQSLPVSRAEPFPHRGVAWSAAHASGNDFRRGVHDLGERGACAAMARAQSRAAEFATRTGMSIANARMKFKQLWEQGFLLRRESVADSGGSNTCTGASDNFFCWALKPFT
jgi:hypothetical protein